VPCFVVITTDPAVVSPCRRLHSSAHGKFLNSVGEKFCKNPPISRRNCRRHRPTVRCSSRSFRGGNGSDARLGGSDGSTARFPAQGKRCLQNCAPAAEEIRGRGCRLRTMHRARRINRFRRNRGGNPSTFTVSRPLASLSVTARSRTTLTATSTSAVRRQNLWRYRDSIRSGQQPSMRNSPAHWLWPRG